MRVHAFPWVSALSMVVVVAVVDMTTADTQTVRVALLEGAGRTSLLVESILPPSYVVQRLTATHVFIVEFGPIGPKISARDYVPDRPTLLTAPITLREAADSKVAGLARISLAICADCAASVRSLGNRIYIDLVRQPAQPGMSTSPVPGPEGQEGSSARSAATDATALGALTVISYDRLVEEAQRRAALLSTRSDVTGLITLRAAVVQRDGEFGHRRPDLIAHLLGDLDRALTDARTRRLAIDRKAFLDSERTGRKQ